MNDMAKDLIVAIEAAFREGFRSPTTYNDTVLNSEDEEWEKSDAKVYISRAEAALAAQQPDADGWIPWEGGECPVFPDTPVNVHLRNGRASVGDGISAWSASQYDWTHTGHSSDIIAYRVGGGSAMTRDDVIRMAKEAGASFETAESMFRFASLIAAEEREACAKVVKNQSFFRFYDASMARDQCVKAILARDD